MLFRIFTCTLLLLIIIPITEAKVTFRTIAYSSQVTQKLTCNHYPPPVEKIKPQKKKKNKLSQKKLRKKAQLSPNFMNDFSFWIYFFVNLMCIVLLFLAMCFLGFGIGTFALGLALLIAGDASAIILSSFSLFMFLATKELVAMLTLFAITFLLNLIFSILLLAGLLAISSGGILGGILLGLAILMLLVFIWFIIFKIAMGNIN